MKRCASVFLAVVLLLALSVSGLADVAFEPNDSFYARHRDECRYENRSYYASGADGYVLVYGSPVGDAKETLANGASVRINYTYDGGAWGQTEYRNEAADGSYTQVSGWVRMADMIVDYDSIAFCEEHADAFTVKKATLQPRADAVIYGYKYPGSGIVVDEISGSWASDELYFKEIFTDPAGREWGQVGYYYGRRDFWVCLSDPFNGALEADENYREVITVPAASEEAAADALRSAKVPAMYSYGAAAAAVVLAGAVLAYALRRKKRA